MRFFAAAILALFALPALAGPIPGVGNGVGGPSRDPAAAAATFGLTYVTCVGVGNFT